MDVALRGSAYAVTGAGERERAALLDLGFAEVEDALVKPFPAGSPLLEAAFGRFRSQLDEIVAQTASERRAPWERALGELLTRAADTRWMLAGSAALAVRGLSIAPRDLDLVTDAPGAHELADTLADALIEPLVETDWVGHWWCRAFLHARIEWIGEPTAAADEPEPSDFGPTAWAGREPAEWNGRRVWLPPLELQLAVSARRGLDDRVAQIDALLR